MLHKFRVKKVKLQTMAQRLDNGTVLNGVLTSPEYGYALQRKPLGIAGWFDVWQHVFWTKKDHVYLDFLLNT